MLGEIRISPDARSAPFLKWPGGKRWLTSRLIKQIGRFQFETYFEPFLGGGALFFALTPSRSVLSDQNAELINAYRRVKYDADSLLRALRTFPVNRQTYYA